MSNRLKSIKDFCAKIGVRIQYCSTELEKVKYEMGMTDAPIAMAELSEYGYLIHLGDKISYGPNEVQVQILAHELAHVLRGDNLLIKNNNYDRRLWNIASDSAINLGLDMDLIEAFLSPWKGIRYQNLRMDYMSTLEGTDAEKVAACPLPAIHPGALKVYEVLLENKEQFEQALKDYLEDLPEFEPTPEEAAKMRAAHVTVTVKARRALMDPEFKDMAGLKGALSAIPTPHSLPLGDYSPETIAQIDEILSLLDGINGSLQFSRTWTRPPRVQNSDFLSRGAGYVPKVRTCIIVDISGSMGPYEPQIVATSKYVQENHDAHVVIHDDGVRYAGDTYPSDVPWGGGTSFREAYDKARAFEPEVVIHFTDGETPDWDTTELPNCPVIWVQPKGCTANARPEDRFVAL